MDAVPDEPEFRCRCGAELATVTVASMTGWSQTYPGRPVEPCTCPRCAHCEQVLDDGDRCPTMDCPLYGIQVPTPIC